MIDPTNGDTKSNGLFTGAPAPFTRTDKDSRTKNTGRREEHATGRRRRKRWRAAWRARGTIAERRRRVYNRSLRTCTDKCKRTE